MQEELCMLKKYVALGFFVGVLSLLVAEATVQQLPLKKISLFSSGIGYFEHSGPVSGDARILISVPTEAINDVLKSLSVSDPSGASVSVEYTGANSVYRSLQSLRINLADNSGLSEILHSMVGEQLRVNIPDSVSGRIVGVEERQSSEFTVDSFLILSTEKGLRSIKFSEIASFDFPDSAIQQDLNRALDMLQTEKQSLSKQLEIFVLGKGSRPVSVSYIAPVPVWKISYRLDLSGKEARFQAWAIVDNASDTDWDKVNLSLVTGRPVSFVQNLFDPYYVQRPELPLSIAGVAQAQTYSQAYEGASMYEQEYEALPAPSLSAKKSLALRDSLSLESQVLSASTNSAAKAVSSGEQFFFTLTEPASIARQKSAMLPLYNGIISGRRVSILSSSYYTADANAHPMLGVELVNTTGIKLPQGPVTVYDGGIYAGDALLDYTNLNEKRFISYGEDLAVSIMSELSSAKENRGVKIAKGLLTFNKAQQYEKKYHLKNSDSKEKTIIIEHKMRPDTILKQPLTYEERTSDAYRFTIVGAGNKETLFSVKEEQALEERFTLLNLTTDAYLSYSSNTNIPEKIKTALIKAANFKQALTQSQEELSVLEKELTAQERVQERLRLNIEASGRDSQQGRDYLKKLAESDSAIDLTTKNISLATKKVQEAKQAYEAYLANLNLE